MLVQTLRLKQGWSQQQLADASGLSVRTVQRMERGQPASVETLKSLAAVFNVDFASLQQEQTMSTASTAALNPADAFTTHQPPNDQMSFGQRLSPAERLEAEAYRHVRKVKGFYWHASIYVVVICTQAVINLITSPHKLWFLYSAMGWGIGLSMHALGVFGKNRWFGPEWERRQVEKRLGRTL
jgi:transcriptional regulator with XRE-family HTH domain